MDLERDATAGTTTLDEQDADGMDWSPAPYYDSLGLTEEATAVHDLSPDDFDDVE